MRRIHLYCFTLLLCSQLIACEATFSEWTQEKQEPVQPQVMQQTAEEYLQLAAQAKSPEQQQYQLDAVRRLLQDKQITRAKQVLDTIHTDKTPQYIHYEKALLKAKIAIADHKPRQAANILRPYRATAVVPVLRDEYLDTFARAQAEDHEIIDSIRLRNTLNASLTNNAKRRGNQMAIWQSVKNLPPTELTELLDSPIPPDVRGWLQLAQLMQQADNDTKKREAAIKQWQESHPDHPAKQILAGIK